MNEQMIVGMTGHFVWLRQRVPFWKRAELEADGYHESRAERLPFSPMMIKRITMQETQNMKTAFMRAALDNGLSVRRR